MKPLLVAALAVFSLAALGQAPLRFVVTGDGRWDTHEGGRPEMDVNGVNVVGMKRLTTAILADKPAYMLFSGDLVGGLKSDEAELSQYKTWMEVMKPVYDARVKVLTVRGNHEMHCDHADVVWRKVFSGDFANPDNGPKGEEDLTYAYPAGNVLFIALDQFQGPHAGVNLDWLKDTIAKNPKTHIFPFFHKMAFLAGNHVDGMNEDPAGRDAFMDILVKAGCRTIFCGHDHFYDHSVVSRPEWPASLAIHQIIDGTAGAPFVKAKGGHPADHDWKISPVAHVEQKLGYCVVDVDGPKVTITFKGETSPGVFEALDTFSYTVGSEG